MEEEKKKLFFLFIFSKYLPVILLKFWSWELVGCEIKFHIQQVPTRHTFDGSCYPWKKKYLKKVMMSSSSCFFKYFYGIVTFFQVFLVFGVAGSIKSMSSGYSLDARHIFSGISYFWGSGVRQKYVEWVLVGCGIIQRALPIEIWVKTQGDMSKMQTKKVVFFMIPIPKFILKKWFFVWYISPNLY